MYAGSQQQDEHGHNHAERNDLGRLQCGLPADKYPGPEGAVWDKRLVGAWHDGMANGIRTCATTGLLSPRRPPPIRCFIVRLPHHNLAIEAIYTISEEHVSSADTFFRGLHRHRQNNRGDSHSLPRTALDYQRSQKHRALGQPLNVRIRYGESQRGAKW